MKNILLLILLIASIGLSAQHPELPEGRWYVKSLTIGGVTTEIPTDLIDFPYAYLTFFRTTTGFVGSENAGSYKRSNCNIGFTGHVNYTGTDIFGFLDFSPFFSTTNTECTASSRIFMDLYVSFYNDVNTGQFMYTVTTEVDDSKTLLVTNNNGDTVVYTNIFFNSAPQELTGNKWYLHDLVINGIDNIPPYNVQLPEITLRFSDGGSSFSTSACNCLFAAHFFDYTLSRFYLYDQGITLSDCSNYPPYTGNSAFSNLYIGVFYLDDFPGPFNYSVTGNGAGKTLAITNSLGSKAIYGNYVLSVQEFTPSKFSVYPNPVSNILCVDSNNTAMTDCFMVYDVSGKLFLEGEIINKKINLSILNNGIWFIKIKTDKGYLTKKNIVAR